MSLEHGARVLVGPRPRQGAREFWPEPVWGTVIRVDPPWAYIKLDRFFEGERAGWFDLARIVPVDPSSDPKIPSGFSRSS